MICLKPVGGLEATWLIGWTGEFRLARIAVETASTTASPLRDAPWDVRAAKIGLATGRKDRIPKAGDDCGDAAGTSFGWHNMRVAMTGLPTGEQMGDPLGEAFNEL